MGSLTHWEVRLHLYVQLNIKLTVLLPSSDIFAYNSKGHCVLHCVWFTFRSCLLKMISGHPPFSLRRPAVLKDRGVFERVRDKLSMDNRICFPLGACEPLGLQHMAWRTQVIGRPAAVAPVTIGTSGICCVSQDSAPENELYFQHSCLQRVEPCHCVFASNGSVCQEHMAS